MIVNKFSVPMVTLSPVDDFLNVQLLEKYVESDAIHHKVLEEAKKKKAKRG